MTLKSSIRFTIALLVPALLWNPVAASAAVPSCVVKLLFSSDDKSDSGTNDFVKQVLADDGYRVIDDWLFTIWSASDYDVKIIIAHTMVPNYGFPVSLMGMQVYVANKAGTVLVNNYVDRSNLEATLRTWIPACGAAPSSTPLPVSDTDTTKN